MTATLQSAVPTDDQVRGIAREWAGRGPLPHRSNVDEPTLLALDGDTFLALRLGRRATAPEAELFWAEVGRI